MIKTSLIILLIVWVFLLTRKDNKNNKNMKENFKFLWGQ